MNSKMTFYNLEDKYNLIKQCLLKETSKNPITIINNIMDKDFVNMHGPEHHFIDGASLMKAMYNAGLKFDCFKALDILSERSIKMPGAMCGYWGICGSVTSIGAVFSIIDETSPISSDENYASHMKYTSNVIEAMSKIGGPRCCKRNAYISITKAVEYVKEKYHITLELDDIKCKYSQHNSQCIKERCPFHK